MSTVIMRRNLARQSVRLAPFPVEGFPLLPACLRDAIPGPLRHAPLSTGEETTALEDLGRTFWRRHSSGDARLVVQALLKRIDWSRESTHDFLSEMRMPFAADLESLLELPLSDGMRKRLEDEGLLDPHELSALSGIDAIVALSLRPRHLLELLAALEVAGAVPVPKHAPADYPGLRIYPASTVTKAQLNRIESVLGPHDVSQQDLRLADLLAKLPTKPGSLKAVLRQLRNGIKRAGSRDPWPAILPVLAEIEERLARFRACNLEEALKDVLNLVFGGPRQVERVALRMGWVDGRPRTLREAAEKFGVTSDLVRRHEATARIRIHGGTSMSSRSSWFCPQLVEAIQTARSLAPCSARELVRALQAARMTRLEWTLETLLKTADLFGIQHGLTVEQERLTLAETGRLDS